MLLINAALGVQNQLTELSGCSIEELISLQHLDVAWNQLKGLPEAVCALPSLKELHASHNRLVCERAAAAPSSYANQTVFHAAECS